MKKLMIAASAALCATVGFSEEAAVQSANVVGYQTMPINQKEIKMFSVQFTKTDGTAIPVKDLVTCPNLQGASGFNDGADQIWTYKNGAWARYFYYSKFSTKEWRAENDATVPPATATLTSGDAFFFQRSNVGANTTLTLAGGVEPLATKKSVPVSPKGIVMLANPWPTSIQINQFDKYYANVTGASGFNDGADQIWTYKNGAWARYFYYSKFSTKEWRTEGGDKVQDTVTVEPGEGFFFQRSNVGAETTITFKGPDCKD